MPWAGVIGSPISHSLSPVIHRAAWRALGGIDWEYRAIDVSRETLPDFIASLDEDCRGLSVTMPCKQDVMPFLDAIDPLAEAVGAVNTVIPGAGIVTGFNTDVHGIATAIRLACEKEGRPLPRSAVILGARATASSALAALGQLGITHSVMGARRFYGPGSAIAAAARLGVDVDQVLFSNQDALITQIARADLLISTLPAHVADPFAAQMRPREDQVFLDVVYSPRDTPMRRAYEGVEALVVEGTDMLVHQGVQQVHLMTGKDVPSAVMAEALEEELMRRAKED